MAPLRAETGPGARQLWSYIAVEDAADALLAGVEAPLRGAHSVYATAPDTYMDEPTVELMAAHYPQATLRGGPHPAHVAVISSQRAEDLLGLAGRRELAIAPGIAAAASGVSYRPAKPGPRPGSAGLPRRRRCSRRCGRPRA